MTTVYFVRHAHSPWIANRQAERPLSEAGRADAERVADLLADRPVDAVVSSPYTRAVQTAEPVAARHGLPLQTDTGFRERRLTDGPVETVGETFESAVAKVWDDWSFALPNGESSDDAGARGAAALERVLDEYDGGSVVVGTHGQLLTCTLNRYDDRFDADFWRDELTTPDVYEAAFEDGALSQFERLWTAPDAADGASA